jgi:acetoacetyl-CoA synthetase
MDKVNPNLIRATMNFTENMLLSHDNARTNNRALVSLIEPDPSLKPGTRAYIESTFLRELSFEELYQEVNKAATALRALGVKPGDRVATFAPANAEATILLLATGTVGAVWSSCPSEFGVKATLERLSQVRSRDVPCSVCQQHH